MIGRLKGMLIHKQPPWLMVEVAGGIGYELEAPMSTFYDLPELGREVVLFTHYAQKEDSVSLYGFLREGERRLFRDDFVCLTRAGHPLAAARGGEPPSFAELLAWPHVSVTVNGEDIDPLSRAFRARGLGRNIIATTPYFAGARDLLSGTDAVVTLPSRAARAFAADRSLSLFPAPPELGGFDYWLTWHNRGHGDPALRWLIDLLARCCAEPPQGNAAAAAAAGTLLQPAE